MTAEKLPSHLKKYIAASLIGNGLEWYDFAIFGYFAPVFSKQFFPTTSPLLSLINIFAVFAVGFLSRPFGAYLFGKMGDQRGRKQAFLFSILLMAFSTFLMGLLPTYDSIGLFAPLLLVLLRVFQGISLGGEFTGSLSFVIEHSPNSRKGLVGALAYSGGFLGSVFGASTGTLVTLCLSGEQLYEWGWRIPFLLGFAIAFLGYYMRRHVDETPAFLELKRTHAIDTNPLKSVSKENTKEILQIIGVLLPNTIWVYLFVFLPIYLIEVMHWDLFYSFIVNMIPSLFALLFIPFGGHLSDLWGRKRVILIGQTGLFLAAPVAFAIFAKGVFIHIIAVQIVISIFFALSCGPTAALLTEMFPPRLRNTGMAMSYHIATGVFGGLTPLILTWLTSTLGMALGSTSMVSAAGIIGLITLMGIKETNQSTLAEVRC